MNLRNVQAMVRILSSESELNSDCFCVCKAAGATTHAVVVAFAKSANYFQNVTIWKFLTRIISNSKASSQAGT